MVSSNPKTLIVEVFKMKLSQSVVLLVLGIAVPDVGVGQQYVAVRAPDGPFSFKILGVELNEGSSMQREGIVLNIVSCPVEITNSSLTFDYADRRFKYKVATEINVAEPILAIEVRHALYDVFGEHMKNLANLEARDFAAGPSSFDGTWNILNENDVGEHLTTVTYVSAVRFVNGLTWKFDVDLLLVAVGALDLEQKVTDEEQ